MFDICVTNKMKVPVHNLLIKHLFLIDGAFQFAWAPLQAQPQSVALNSYLIEVQIASKTAHFQIQ